MEQLTFRPSHAIAHALSSSSRLAARGEPGNNLPFGSSIYYIVGRYSSLANAIRRKAAA